jgi:hypothetical protein
VSRQVAGEEGVGAITVLDPGDPELRYEPVLQRAPEALDATLGLRAARGDRADAELAEGTTEVRRDARIDELFLERERCLLGRPVASSM